MTKKILLFVLMIILISACSLSSTKPSTDVANKDDKTVKIKTEDKKDENTEKQIDYSKIEYVEINNLIISFADNLEKWQEIDEKLIASAENKDVDTMFLEYKNFQIMGNEILNQIETIYFALEAKKAENTTSYLFAPIANAKERWSMWYYVPVVGSLIKAKHQSIETTRAGIYQYMQNLPETDRQDFLSEYRLNNIEEIKNADDATVEKLARDPEIRGGIDWTKVTTDLGKTAVETVVDTSKTVLSGGISPIKDTATSFIDDIKDGEIDKIEDETGKIKIKQEKENDNSTQVDMGIKQDVQDKISSINPKNEGKKWADISEEDKEDIAKTVIDSAKNSSIIIVVKKDANDEKSSNVPVGDWDFISTNSDSVPIEIPDITIEKDVVVDITKPEIDLSKHINLDFLDKLEIKKTNLNLDTENENIASNEEVVIDKDEITELLVFEIIENNFTNLDVDGNKVLTNNEIENVRNNDNSEIVSLILKHSHELMFVNIDSNSSAWHGMTSADVSGIANRLRNGSTIAGTANSLRSKYAEERGVANDYQSFKAYVDSNR